MADNPTCDVCGDVIDDGTAFSVSETVISRGERQPGQWGVLVHYGCLPDVIDHYPTTAQEQFAAELAEHDRVFHGDVYQHKDGGVSVYVTAPDHHSLEEWANARGWEMVDAEPQGEEMNTEHDEYLVVFKKRE